MALDIESLDTFIYGMNIRETEENLVLGETFDSENFEIESSGERLSRRFGFSWFDASGTAFTNTGFGAIQNIFAWETSADTWIYLVSNEGDIFSISEAGVRTQLFNGTSGTVWTFVAADDSTSTARVWAMNGTDAPQKITAGSPPTIAAWGGSPPNGRAHTYWRGRMVVGNYSGEGDRLAFSTPGDPETWALTTSFVDLKSSNDDSDFVQRLEVLGESLIALKRKSTWKVLDPSSFANIRLFDFGVITGFLNPSVGRSCVLGSSVYFCSEEGIYETDGVSVRLTSSRMQIPGRGGLQGSSTDNLFLAPMADRLFAFRTDQTVQTIIYEYYPNLVFTDPHSGLEESPWMIHKLSGFVAMCGLTVEDSDERRTFVGGTFTTPSPNLPKVVRWNDPGEQTDKNENDTDVEIFAEWNSGRFRLGSKEEMGRLIGKVRLRKVVLMMGSAYKHTAVSKGFAEGQIDVIGWNRRAGSGESVLDTSLLATGSLPSVLHVRPEVKGDAFRIKINTMSGDTEPLAVVAPIEFHYRQGGKTQF